MSAFQIILIVLGLIVLVTVVLVILVTKLGYKTEMENRYYDSTSSEDALNHN